MDTSYIEAWRKARHQDVKATFGDLALQSLIEINEATTIDNIPGLWKPNEHAGTGLIATFIEADDVCKADGSKVVGDISLVTDEGFVAIDEYRYAMATAQPGSPFLLAIYNTKHEALSTFSFIENFAFNEQHIYVGSYVEVEQQSFMFQHTTDMKAGRHEAGRAHQSNTAIKVDIAGEHYVLRPFAAGNLNIIVFRDKTSDEDTYPVGRMIIAEPLAKGQVKLDFNKAFLPPCAFSPHFNCPMPPLSNRIQSSIDAGEKRVVWKA